MDIESKEEIKENIHENEPWRRKKFDAFVRIVATIICLILFFANSFVIFQQCISGKTIVFSDFNFEQDKIHFPLIVICNYSSYKNTELTRLNVNDYRRNTLDIEMILDSVTLGYLSNYTYLMNDTFHSTSLSVWPISTFYRGRCYSYKFQKEVVYNYRDIRINND